MFYSSCETNKETYCVLKKQIVVLRAPGLKDPNHTDVEICEKFIN